MGRNQGSATVLYVILSVIKYCTGHYMVEYTVESDGDCKIQQLERPVISLLHMLWIPKGTLRCRQCVLHGLGVCLRHG